MSLKNEYKELILKELPLKEDDLTETENKIIDIGFSLLKEKFDDIKILNDEIRRISIENANLKSYHSKD